MPSRLFRVSSIGLTLLLAGCSSSSLQSPPPSQSSPQTKSLLESRLLDVIEMEKRLDAEAAMENAQTGNVQRQFHAVAAAYRDLIASNPESLETRLLYGKLLSRYGDREGARDQFLLAARLDSEVAVIHQQLSTYYAEEQDHTRALAFMLNAVELEPQTAAYHFGMGQLLHAFREAFLEDKVYTEEQLDAQMLAAFKAAAEGSPQEAALQFRYGEAFYDVAQPDWETALQHWMQTESSLQLDPLQSDALQIHKARCYLGLERPDDARQCLQSVTSDSLLPSAEALLELISHEAG